MLTVWFAATALAADKAERKSDAARALLLAGKYEEAAEAYAASDEDEPVASAVGLARARAAAGKRDEAAAALAAALAKHPQSAALLAESARSALCAVTSRTPKPAAPLRLRSTASNCSPVGCRPKLIAWRAGWMRQTLPTNGSSIITTRTT